VRASCQNRYIDQAIARVVSNWTRTDVRVEVGCSPEVRSCEDYADRLGHLKGKREPGATPSAAAEVGSAIAEYYLGKRSNCAFR
jgi:hypothetical protein